MLSGVINIFFSITTIGKDEGGERSLCGDDCRILRRKCNQAFFNVINVEKNLKGQIISNYNITSLF